MLHQFYYQHHSYKQLHDPIKLERTEKGGAKSATLLSAWKGRRFQWSLLLITRVSLQLKKKSLVVAPYDLPNKVEFIQIRLAITTPKTHLQTYSVQSHWLVPFPGYNHTVVCFRGSDLPGIFCLPWFVYWNGIQPSTTIVSIEHSLSLQIHINHFLLAVS